MITRRKSFQTISYVVLAFSLIMFTNCGDGFDLQNFEVRSIRFNKEAQETPKETAKFIGEEVRNNANQVEQTNRVEIVLDQNNEYREDVGEFYNSENIGTYYNLETVGSNNIVDPLNAIAIPIYNQFQENVRFDVQLFVSGVVEEFQPKVRFEEISRPIISILVNFENGNNPVEESQRLALINSISSFYISAYFQTYDYSRWVDLGSFSFYDGNIQSLIESFQATPTENSNNPHELFQRELQRFGSEAQTPLEQLRDGIITIYGSITTIDGRYFSIQKTVHL